MLKRNSKLSEKKHYDRDLPDLSCYLKTHKYHIKDISIVRVSLDTCKILQKKFFVKKL